MPRQYSPEQAAKRRRRRNRFYAELRRNNHTHPATETRDTPEGEEPNDDRNED